MITPVGKGRIEPGPPTSSQEVGRIVDVIRSISESKSACPAPPRPPSGSSAARESVSARA